MRPLGPPADPRADHGTVVPPQGAAELAITATQIDNARVGDRRQESSEG